MRLLLLSVLSVSVLLELSQVMSQNVGLCYSVWRNNIKSCYNELCANETDACPPNHGDHHDHWGDHDHGDHYDHHRHKRGWLQDLFNNFHDHHSSESGEGSTEAPSGGPNQCPVSDSPPIGDIWCGDCQRDIAHSHYAAVGIHRDSTEFDQVDLIKCAETDVGLDYGSVSVVDVQQELGECPNNAVVVALSAVCCFNNTKELRTMKCVAVENGDVDYSQCVDLRPHGDGLHGGTKSLIPDWQAQCDFKTHFYMVGLGATDNAVTSMRCCKVNVAKQPQPFSTLHYHSGLCARRLRILVGGVGGTTDPADTWNTDCGYTALTSIHQVDPCRLYADNVFEEIEYVKCLRTGGPALSQDPADQAVVDTVYTDPNSPPQCPTNYLVTAINAELSYQELTQMKCSKLTMGLTVNYSDCHLVVPNQHGFVEGNRQPNGKWRRACHFERGYYMVGIGFQDGIGYDYMQCCGVVEPLG